MIERIRDGLWYLKLRLSCRGKRQAAGRGRRGTFPKGTVRPVIVVKPDNAMFDQAMFFLSEEYMRQQSRGAEELLAQARAAAAEYMSRQPELSVSCGRGRGWLWLLLPFFLVAAAAAVLYFVPGVSLFCPKA